MATIGHPFPPPLVLCVVHRGYYFIFVLLHVHLPSNVGHIVAFFAYLVRFWFLLCKCFAVGCRCCICLCSLLRFVLLCCVGWCIWVHWCILKYWKMWHGVHMVVHIWSFWFLVVHMCISNFWLLVHIVRCVFGYRYSESSGLVSFLVWCIWCPVVGACVWCLVWFGELFDALCVVLSMVFWAFSVCGAYGVRVSILVCVLWCIEIFGA